MRLSSQNLSDIKILNAQNRAVKCLELSLVIPTYNERENIEELIVEICHVLDDVIEKQYEIIVVDDRSPDRTGEVVRGLRAQYPQVRLISRNRKKGLATAVIDGWKISQGKILGVIDGDCQHPPQTLKKLLRAIFKGADLAIASRYIKKNKVESLHFFRCLLSHIARLIVILILPKTVSNLSDPLSGFFLVRYNAICIENLTPLGYKVLLEIIAKSNISKTEEVSFTLKNRSRGCKKLTTKQCLEFLLHVFNLRCKFIR